MIVFTYEQHLIIEEIRKEINSITSWIIKEREARYGVVRRHDKMYRDLLSDRRDAAEIINTVLGLKNKITSDDIEKYESNK